ncbi:MAG TPA: PDZ domain-containing protein, partial [Blastocatellia bacterium]|nr:PDZ domain-containing protein [Blastocatellia bacterium]
MTLRIPLYLTFILLLSLGVNGHAQQPSAPPPPAQPAIAPPPPPQSPPEPAPSEATYALAAPPAAPQAPDAPDAPTDFSFFMSDSYLGIYPEEVDAGNAKQYGLGQPRGVGVGRVIEGSSAERAGLKKNDVILRFNNEEVTGIRKLNRLVAEVAPDHTVRLTISRNGVEQEISVTIARREGFPRSFNLMTPGREGADDSGREAGRLGNLPGFEGGDFSLVFGANRRIGIGAQALTKQLADYFNVPGGRGVLITSVGENSPAARAGLKAGDVITAVNGTSIEKIADLLRELNRKGDGEVTLSVIRDKSQRTFKLTPERGRGFEFGPEINITPQVGQLVIPQIAMPALPAFKLEKMPKFVLPVMP